MSAADRMVVRTRDGSYRSFPRRTALGLISRGQATAAAAAVPQAAPPAEVDPLGPHGDEYQEKRDQLLTDMAAALNVPVEVLTPIEDGVNHWSAADDSAEMAAALGISALPPLTTVDVEITTTLETAELLGARDIRVARPAEPRGNASRQEWAEYAVSLGVEVTDGMSRNRIRDAAQDVAQTLARLPQPALPGGRLETPEDEPVTEESVTDDEDPGTE